MWAMLPACCKFTCWVYADLLGRQHAAWLASEVAGTLRAYGCNRLRLDTRTSCAEP